MGSFIFKQGPCRESRLKNCSDCLQTQILYKNVRYLFHIVKHIGNSVPIITIHDVFYWYPVVKVHSSGIDSYLPCYSANNNNISGVYFLSNIFIINNKKHSSNNRIVFSLSPLNLCLHFVFPQISPLNLCLHFVNNLSFFSRCFFFFSYHLTKQFCKLRNMS